ncbi:epoxide hydrolase protein [Rutstroemia sp. NJR-2017a WRK4]|nr:epoxide hydrolase protein [Rutstroemia sp. NJR-2017a WRK4]
MALSHLQTPGTVLELEDGIKYAYIHIAAISPKPTFLLLHGFPSTSYDWRFQIASLKSLGYGVIAPDLLGYGDTDKPKELERYKFKSMASDLVQILNHESLEKVIGVGHDWGSGMLSRFANYYPERLSALVFVSVGYVEPGPLDLVQIKYSIKLRADAVNAMTEQAFGYPTFGYWKFFNEDDAAEVCEHHNESLTSLLYSPDPDIWKTEVGPVGAAKAFITADKSLPLPTWLDASEVAIHNQLFTEGGYTGPLSWYKATIRGINDEDDAKIPEERKFLASPTHIIVSDKDTITRAEVAEQSAPVRLRNYEIIRINGSGHWIWNLPYRYASHSDIGTSQMATIRQLTYKYK